MRLTRIFFDKYKITDNYLQLRWFIIKTFPNNLIRNGQLIKCFLSVVSWKAFSIRNIIYRTAV